MAAPVASPSIETWVPVAVLRNLVDRNFDKRKLAAQEIERIVRSLKAGGQNDAIRKLIVSARDAVARCTSTYRVTVACWGFRCHLTPSHGSPLQTVLATEFAAHSSANNRKGGLIALASAALALGPATADQLDLLVPAVLKSFGDPESRLRYYACESMFNITKTCRGAILR